MNEVFYRFPHIYTSLSDKHKTESAYNIILSSRGSGDLAPLKDQLIVGKEYAQLELLGDSIYIQSGSHDDVVDYYRRSLALKYDERVEKKISLLTDATAPTSTGYTTSSGSSSPSNNDSYLTGATSTLVDARYRIEDDAQERGKYLYRSQDAYIIQDTLDFLEEGKERVDW